MAANEKQKQLSGFLADLTAKRSVYLDFAATEPMLPVAKAAMQEFLAKDWGNPAALHSQGYAAALALENARTQVAKLINADPSEIIFTSGGSESNNTIIRTFQGQKIAVSSIEHPSVLDSARAYAGELAELSVNASGVIDAEQDFSSYDLVSVMLANNELGTIQPVAELAKKCKSLHTDATQALGKIPVDVKKLNVDYLTASAHKVGGPVGIGILYVRDGAPLKPLILGGHQENRRRAGTANALLAVGFGAAAEFILKNQIWQQYQQKIQPLRDYLAEQILAKIPYSSLNTPLQISSGVNRAQEAPKSAQNPEKSATKTPILPNILNASFQAAEGESIQLYLDTAGIAVSTGSACAAGDIQPSHVLMATAKNAEIAHSSIRFSLGLTTTKADIDYVLKILPEIIKKLQLISTVEVKNG